MITAARTLGAGLVLLVLVASLAGCERTSSQSAAAPESGPVAPDSAWVMPVPEAGYNVREGSVLFRHYCLICHGEEGHGDGFNAYNLDPKPRDLADAAFQAQRSDDELAAIIRSGGGVAGLSTGMPPWGRTLDERKIRNLVDYLRAIRAAPEPAP